ncbi:MAG: type VI secretion system baseplate subunit TssE [Sandaracinaceae bacterium]|nr:type VI secretion system baseplate subunit TssE [Sandaracinaceae bacterium]
MSARGFLSRLASGDRRQDVVSSVVAHLNAMLNTRAGESVTVPDYGLMDFQDVVHTMPEAIGTIQQCIRATILKYEPRLKNVSVRFVPGEDPLILRFEVVARLSDARRSVVRLQTAMVPGGRINVD